MSRFRKLRLESLESKNLLAGDVTAALVGGDLFITGDLDNNSIQIISNGPGVGELSIEGLFGTTVNMGASDTFTVSGEIYLDYSAGGDNDTFIGQIGGPITLPGGISVAGSSGIDNHFVSNTFVNGDVTVDDSAGGAFGFLGVDQGSEVTGDVTATSFADSTELDVDSATVDGTVTFDTGSSSVSSSFLGVENATIGRDLIHTSDAASSTTLIQSVDVGDDLVLDLGDGDDLVTLEISGSSVVGNTIGDDFIISTGGGGDELTLTEFSVGDDLRFDTGEGDDVVTLTNFSVSDDLIWNGGAGEDVFLVEAGGDISVIGDDVILTGGADGDEIGLEETEIGDKLRVAAGAGDDSVFVVASTIGRSALISLGAGFNESEIEDVDAGRSLTVLAKGTNEISLAAVTTSHFVTVLTSNGDDVIELEEVSTYSAMVATKSGNDEVAIVDSAFEFLHVQLGSGDDVLTLEGVTVERLAVLSGGGGAGDELIDEGDNDINFAIDFAFESGSI